MGRFFLRFVLFVCVCVFTLPSMGGAAEREVPTGKTLSFGVYTHVRSTEMLKKMEPFRKYLEDAMVEKGVPHSINMRIYPSYSKAIEALAAGNVDFVRFGPVSYVLAKKQNPDIQLLAMESNNGKKRFNGVLSVAKDSAIHSLEQIRGRTVAFGSRKSTTGRYLAQAALLKAGLHSDDLAGHSYLGRHDKVVYSVSAGKYAVGASNENTFNKYAETRGLRQLITFPCVTKPWVARAKLEPHIMATLKSVLFELKSPQVLKTIKRSGFLPGTDAEYDLIREGMALARQFDIKTIQVATYAAEKPTKVFAKVQPILAELERRLDEDGWHVRFENRIYPTYTKAIRAMARGYADLARMGAASYVLAKEQNAKIRLLVVEEAAGEDHHGIFVVKNDSTINALSDLKGRSLAFGSKHSTLSRYMPQAELIKNGLNPGDLSSYSYLGRHDKVVLAVSLGNYDAGAVRESVFDHYRDEKKLRSIYKFTAPYHGWVVAEKMDEELFSVLQSAFVSVQDKQYLANIKRSGFKLANDALYNPVREAMRLSKVFNRDSAIIQLVDPPYLTVGVGIVDKVTVISPVAQDKPVCCINPATPVAETNIQE